MNVEDRLRSALREAAQEAPPTPEKWDAVRAGASAVRSRRRTQRFVAAGLSAAALAAVAVALLWAREPGEHEQGFIQEPKPDAGPAYVVTAQDDGLFVRDARTGRELRRLIEDPVNDVAVSPDGSQVYFDRYTGDCAPGKGGLNSEIVRMPVAGGGPPEHVALGSAPAISPDGNYLAYVAAEDPKACGASEFMLELRNLRTGEVRVVPMRGALVTTPPMSFSPDGTRLLAGGVSGADTESGYVQRLFLIEGLPAQPTTRELTVPSTDADPAADRYAVFLSDEVVATWAKDDDFAGVLTFDLATGKVRDRLFEFDAARVISELRVDQTGERLLFTSNPGNWPPRPRPLDEHGHVHSWSEAEGLRRIRSGLARDAAWAAGPAEPPERFVAVTKDGELQVRRTRDGSVDRVLARGLAFPTRVSVSPDGRFLYHDGVGTEPCPHAPGGLSPMRGAVIARVAVEDGRSETVTSGAQPAVSPDGLKLAYVESSDRTCTQDALVVRDLSSGSEQRWPAGAPGSDWNVLRPNWSPDSRMLQFTLDDGQQEIEHLLDTIEPEASTLAEMYVIPSKPGPIDGGVTEYGRAFAYSSVDELLVAFSPEDSTYFVTIDPVSGDLIRELTQYPGTSITQSVAVSADGEHVMYTTWMRGNDDEDLVMTTRFSVGALQGARLADDVVTATWLPD